MRNLVKDIPEIFEEIRERSDREESAIQKKINALVENGRSTTWEVVDLPLFMFCIDQSLRYYRV